MGRKLGLEGFVGKGQGALQGGSIRQRHEGTKEQGQGGQGPAALPIKDQI